MYVARAAAVIYSDSRLSGFFQVNFWVDIPKDSKAFAHAICVCY